VRADILKNAARLSLALLGAAACARRFQPEMPSDNLREQICGSTAPVSTGGEPNSGTGFDRKTAIGFEPSDAASLMRHWSPNALIDNGRSFQIVCKEDPRFKVPGLFDRPDLGRCVARFEVRSDEFTFEEDRTNGPHGSNRAEIKEQFTASSGGEYWYAFDSFIPPDFPLHDNRLVIAQWRATDDPGEEGSARSPALAVRYQNGVLRVTLRQSQERIQKDNDGKQEILYELPDFPRGTWHRFVFHVKWSCQPDGFVKGWLNGRRVIGYKGPVGYNDEQGPKFKFGLYRDNVPETYVIFHDNYRRGNRCEDLLP